MPTSAIKEKSIQATETLKILSDPTRFEILELLMSTSDELCVKEIAETVGMSHSATSHQLNRLEDKGIVSSHRTGQTICYTVISSPLTATLRHIINQFT
jgi:ArsR family transcriptional regulator, lead/cadmium/zinc/bismuth-responsive transcriptional repressor